jgi:hypothetical protein
MHGFDESRSRRGADKQDRVAIVERVAAGPYGASLV